MAIKKSDLCFSLWAGCDQLRGGMDASQYKDCVLFMLFIKYISDKYADSDDFVPPVVIPQGASFKDMAALKGKLDIGDKINTQIIQPLIDANARLARSDFPNFNDPEKLGTGAEMVERLTNLISIFQKPELDFSKNRAEHDDILGDAYEYAITQFQPEVSGRFVHLCMSFKFGAWAMQNTVKATVDSLRLPTFQTFKFSLPPTINEQAAIASVLSDMDTELTFLEARRDKTRALKQGMT